ncbi:MAG: hypothetical protein IZT55_03790 [Anaerolineae bacterium]|nr:hypothetical protein [Anaerolineae bacterium]
MSTWKILIADKLNQDGVNSLNAAAQVENQPGIPPQDLLHEIHQYDALIVRGRTKVTADVFAAAPNLKVVGRAGVGVDNIDLAAAQSHGITIVNTPTATTTAVAEHALALMLATIRFVPRADSTMKSGQWLKKEFIGSELLGKTLGIIGMGNIGSGVAQRAAAFGMTVLGYDPFLTPDEIQQRGAKSVQLEDIYSGADMISLHIPLTPETRNLINGQTFAHMKRGVVLICTARGGLIDETALVSALENGQVAAAALDVFSSEPPGLTALVAHPRVIATPHLGAQTKEAQVRAAVNIAEEVLAALNGDQLRWKIV